MITLSLIKNTGGTAQYYAKEDSYYLSEADAKEASLWLGKSAAELGLSGKKVEEKELQNLLAGKLPNGITIGLQKNGTINHRAGYDICFHAPKSVSILALDGKDKRFYDAHLNAVRETINFIERDCAQAKVFKNKQVTFENTKNLVVALVRHTASRELDPHLHHHALVMNATQRQDGTWRALASSKVKTNGEVSGFFERVHNNQIYYGLIYQSALANKVVQMGCEIEIVGKHGLWEIKGVPKEAREVMSKRRLQIEERIDKLNYRSMKAADVAALDTRKVKPKDMRLANIQQAWKDELATVGFSTKEFLAKLALGHDEASKKMDGLANVLETNSSNTKNQTAKEAIKDSIEHLSQYNLKLDYAKIIAQALEFSIGRNTHLGMTQALNSVIKEGGIIPLDKSASLFVTKELIETEKSIVDIVSKDKETKRQNIVLDLKGKTANNIISGEAKDCAINALQSKHRLGLIESRAPDNTALLSAILNLSEASGKIVHILSPNRMMANDINENIKRKPSNLWQWLVSLGKPELGESVAGFKYRYKQEVEMPLLKFRQGKEVIVINSAEALGSNDMHSLLALTERTNAKVIFLQDLSARQGFNAGNAVETLKQGGIETFKINAPARELSLALELKGIQDNDERTQQLARAYAVQTGKEFNEAKIIVGAKEQIKTTNEAIRKELKRHGKLSGVEHTVSVLNPVYMSKPESTIAHRYQKNMVVRFYGKNHLHKDWKIESINKEQNTLGLIQNNKRRLWNPKLQKTQTNHAIFKAELLPIAAGDKLVVTRNMPDLGVKNAMQFIVQEVSTKYVKLLSNSDQQVTKVRLDTLQNSHFQHNYATTLSKTSQNPKCHVLADFKAYALDKTTIDTLTECSKSLTIFTNDATTAHKRLGHIPIKLTATEALFEASKVEPIKVNRLVNDKTAIEIKQDVEQAIAALGRQQELLNSVEQRAVDFAIDKITSHNAGFTHKELVAAALVYALQEHTATSGKAVTHDGIMKIITEKRASGELVMGKHFNDGTRWTTKKILEQERSIIRDLKRGRDKFEPLLDSKVAHKLLDGSVLTRDQKNACHLITTSKDQFVMVQGYAGTGKTTMFAHLQNMLKGVDLTKTDTDNHKTNPLSKTDVEKDNKARITKNTATMLALAPTHRAVKELKSVGIEAQTLKSFLVERQREKLNINSSLINSTAPNRKSMNQEATQGQPHLDHHLIILDEASMVSNKDFAQFLQVMDNSKGRVVLSGDIAQHIAVSSGKPFEIAQRSNILQTAHLREIVRQKNPNLKDAVEKVIHGNHAAAFTKIADENPQEHIKRINFGPAKIEDDRNNSAVFSFFNTLKQSIVEVDNNKLKANEKTLEEMAAEDFLSRTQDTKDQTVVIVHSNYDRRVITDFIRKGLKKQGDIAPTGIKVNCLIPKGLTDTEHKSMQSYNVGDVVKFGREYYHVTANDPSSKSLLLKDTFGKTKHFYPEKYIDKYNVELYEHTKSELAVGDNIRLTKTDKARRLYANFEYKVKTIKEAGVVLEGKDSGSQINASQEIILNPKELKDAHWDYAQTVTGYGIQGGSKPYAIDFEVSYRKNLANQRSFYIGASRAIQHLAIYTDSKERLLKRILSNKGDKYAALEVSRDLPFNNNLPPNDDSKSVKTLGAKDDKYKHPDFYDVKEITKLLSDTAESFVEKFLGRPNEKLSSASQWRYGNKGSLVISMQENNKGVWHNFETGESGNLLSLIQKEIGLPFRDTLKYVANMFSLGINSKASGRHKTAKSAKSHRVDHNNKTTEYARQLATESIPIANTLAEKYLKEVRGINNVDSDDIRYHPKVYAGKNTSAGEQKYLPAMLALGRDKEGKLQCVQATYLNAKTAGKADIDVQKRTYASPSGASVSLQKHKSGAEPFLIDGSKNNKISLFAEGVETGLSVKDAIKNADVQVTLGKSNFTTIDPKSTGQRIIFCLDNDGTKASTDNIIHKAAQLLIERGKEVFITMPQQIGGAKTDFNDLAKAAGTEAVKNHINNSVPYNEWKNSLDNGLNKAKDLMANHVKFTEKPGVNEYINNKLLYNTLIKNSEISLNKAAMFTASEQRYKLDRNLIAYKEIQSNLDAVNRTYNKSQNTLSAQTAQKNLAKMEKEI